MIVVDDGVATGVTATAILRALHDEHPRTLVFAAPTCAPDAAAALRGETGDVICVAEPETFAAVGDWYRDFRQTTDEDVLALLKTHQ